MPVRDLTKELCRHAADCAGREAAQYTAPEGKAARLLLDCDCARGMKLLRRARLRYRLRRLCNPYHWDTRVLLVANAALFLVLLRLLSQ